MQKQLATVGKAPLAGLRYDNHEYVLIQPFIRKIKRYNADSPEEHMSFFIKSLLSAIKTVRKREIVPVWTKNKEEYKIRSEIQICSSLFAGMLSEPYPKIIDKVDQAEYDSKVYAFAIMAYERIEVIAKEKHWDLNLLHYQMFKDLHDKIAITNEPFLAS
jgi:hypothetical protein